MDWPMMYGAIISTTGWTFEYVDDLGMNRALELLDFMARKPRQRLSMDEGVTVDSPRTLTEKEAMDQFRAAQSMIPVAGGIPPALRDMIAWAEEEKFKRGVQ